MRSRRYRNTRRINMFNVRVQRSSMSSVSETTRNCWSKLPEDLLCLIVDRIVNPKDFIRFRSVCKDWLSAIPPDYRQFTPWLLAKRFKSPVVVLKGLCSLLPSDNISLSSLFETELHWRFWGSFTGWILGQNNNDYRLKLINPLTKVVIDLPRLNHLIRKGVVYHNPDSDSRNPTIGIMAISHRLIGIASIDGKYNYWKFFADAEGVRQSNFVDLVWYKDNIVALRANGTLVFYDEAKVVRLVYPKPVIVRAVQGLGATDQLYLVESAGDLLMVTYRFQVYKLNLDNGNWKYVRDLGRHSLFVGNSYSMSCLIPDDETEYDNETEHRWRPSCIYDATYSSTKSGMLSRYNLMNQTKESHYLGPITDLDNCYDFIWYMPAVGFN
ncbi:F-box protein At2g26160-like [Apium graveolens]|uniref:F-box protein At2g26160-like n=1 Tax=Apium graveolens TaxID=4045 RepID=UPI003D7948C6